MSPGKSSFLPFQVCFFLPQVLGRFSSRLATSLILPLQSSSLFSGQLLSLHLDLLHHLSTSISCLLRRPSQFICKTKACYGGTFCELPTPNSLLFLWDTGWEVLYPAKGSHVSRSWTLSLSSTTLWWGDTTTHEGLSRISVPQEPSHKMMRHSLSLMSPLFPAPSDIFWHYTMFPFPDLPIQPLFPQPHPKYRYCCRSQPLLSMPHIFPAGASCMFVHTVPSSFLLLPHSSTQHSLVWFWPLTGCWCGMNPSH